MTIDRTELHPTIDTITTLMRTIAECLEDLKSEGIEIDALPDADTVRQTALQIEADNLGVDSKYLTYDIARQVFHVED